MADRIVTAHDPSAEAVNGFHAAALDPEQWPDALRRVAGWIDCACVCVATQGLSLDRVSHWRWPDHPKVPGHEQGWCCVARAACPIRFERAARDSVPAVAALDHPMCASMEIREWSERIATMIHHCFAARASVTDTQHGYLCVRWNRVPAVDCTRRALIRHLVGYLGSALRTGALVDELRGKVDTLSTVVDQLPVGVVVLNDDASLRYANRSAQALLAARDGLCLDGREPHAMRPGDDARLRTLIGEQASRTTPHAIRIPRPSGRPAYAVRRIPPGHTDGATGLSPATTLIINDPSAAPVLTEQTLRSLYGFTRAEARLARHLVAGHTVAQAAAALGVTAGTARRHLEHLFKKTATHRQSELIRLLLESPAAFGPTPPE